MPPVFAGINQYLDVACRGHPDEALLRHRAANDEVLSEIGNLLGQAVAWGPGATAAGMVDQISPRLNILYVRIAAAEAALADAQAMLGIVPLPSDPDPTDD